MTGYYSEENHGPHQYFELGDFELENGITLPGAKIAYAGRSMPSSLSERKLVLLIGAAVLLMLVALERMYF